MHPSPSTPLTRFWLPLLLAIVGFLQYANTFSHAYAWDDKLVITSNPHTRMGFAGIPEIIQSKVSVPNKNVYRPVPQVMFAVEYGLFGENPAAGHILSALCYALLCGVCFAFLRAVFATVNPWVHFAVVLLFAVHPLHVEVVANIKSRDEILAMLFGLLGTLALLRGADRESWGWTFAGMALLGLGILSKPNALTFVPVFWAAHWYRVPGRFWDRALLLPAFASLVVLGVYFAHTGAMVLAAVALLLHAAWVPRKALLPLSVCVAAALPLLFQNPAALEPGDGYNLISEASVLNNVLLDPTHPELVRSTAVANLGRYLGLFVYPSPLVHLYGYGQVPRLGPEAPLTLLSLGLLILGIAHIVLGLPRREPVAFGIFFFLVTISVYSNFWVTVPDTMADRFMFIPSLGLCLALVHGVLALLRIDAQGGLRVGWRSQLATVALSMAVCGASIHTYAENRDWENDSTLIKNRIADMPGNSAAHAMLGFVQYQDGRALPDPAQRIPHYQEALKSFHRALAIYPNFFAAWLESGKIFAEVQNFDKAELCFLKAIQLEPLSPDGHSHLGTLYYLMQAFDDAVPYLEQSIALNPYPEHMYELLASAYRHAGKIEEMYRTAQFCADRFPHNAEFDALQGIYHFQRKDWEQASGCAMRALSKSSQNLTAQTVLALLAHAPAQGDSTRNF